MEKLRILGFAGSLRVGSYNRALLRAATDLLPDGTTLEIFDLDGIPPFNQDVEMNMPAKVKEFKSKIGEADAILGCRDEYARKGKRVQIENRGSRRHIDCHS